MPKRIYPKHVQKHGQHMTYVLSIAGERVQGGMYHTATIASYEAEIVKRYARARYGTKAAAMRPAVSEADLQAYATERGYDLSYPAIFQFLPPWIREMFTDRGGEIGRNFEELEPRALREVLVTEGRRERHYFKLARIAAQKAASIERAAAWKQAQIAVAEAWRKAKENI